MIRLIFVERISISFFIISFFCYFQTATENNIPVTCRTVYSGRQNIICYKKNDSIYYLRDLTKGNGIITLHGDNPQNADYVSRSPNWNLNGIDQYALDVHYGISQTYLFYKTLFNRNGVDDNGYAIYSYVNDPGVPNNAIWDGHVMRFGIQASTGKCVATLDIIGHELTHAVTSFTSHLHSGGESGAISESISDIMGKSIEFWSNSNNSNWVISNEMNYNVRDMSNPKAFHQPDTYKDSVYWYRGSRDDKNDHINSGVGNYMFYLLVNGGSGINSLGVEYNVERIGLLAADSIIYLTEKNYLQSNSQYCDWRDACIKATVDLHGENSKQKKSVVDAWNAVGVPSCKELFRE